MEPGDFEGAGIEIDTNNLTGLHGRIEGTRHGDILGLILWAPRSKAQIPGGATPTGKMFLKDFGLKDLRGGAVQERVCHGGDSASVRNCKQQSGQN